MRHIEFHCHKIRYNKMEYQILIPNDISQLWIYHFVDSGPNLGEVSIYGNRKGLEALRNACAALAENDNIVVYFPCKDNMLPRFMEGEVDGVCVIQLDLILMKPNSLKISDWKQIRNRIRKNTKKVKTYELQRDFKDMHNKSKFAFKKPLGKEIFNFNSVFYNIPEYEYPSLAADIEDILRPDAEEVFRETLKTSEFWFGRNCFYKSRSGSLHGGIIETELNYFDNDIFNEVNEQYYMGGKLF